MSYWNGIYHLILTEDENLLLDGTLKLFAPFEILTTNSQATTYPTINLELLFKSEIESKLEELNKKAFLDGNDTIVTATRLLKTYLEQYFPTAYDAVAAAMLDPITQFLPQNGTYLSKNNISKAD